MQVAHKNKALMEFVEMDDQEDVDSEEEFDMSAVEIPDLGLDDHAVNEDFREEVSAAQ